MKSLNHVLFFASFGLCTLANASGVSSACTIVEPGNARITIEEFEDFICPYCSSGSATIKEVLKLYPNQIRLVFRNFPLPFHNPIATTAAKAMTAICLQSPALANLFQGELFLNQDHLQSAGEAYLYEVATKLGADVTRLKTDMAGTEVARTLADDQKAAELQGFKGTPSFIIGGQPVQGAVPLSEFKKIIDSQLGN